MAVLLAVLAGCGGSQRLETGYKYRPLNSTDVERRAFYADPYSREAQAAEIERRQSGRPAPQVRPRGN